MALKNKKLGLKNYLELLNFNSCMGSIALCFYHAKFSL